MDTETPVEMKPMLQLFGQQKEKEPEKAKTDESPEISDLLRRMRKLEMRIVNCNSRMDRMEQDFDDFVASFDETEEEESQ